MKIFFIFLIIAFQYNSASNTNDFVYKGNNVSYTLTRNMGSDVNIVETDVFKEFKKSVLRLHYIDSMVNKKVDIIDVCQQHDSIFIEYDKNISRNKCGSISIWDFIKKNFEVEIKTRDQLQAYGIVLERCSGKELNKKFKIWNDSLDITNYEQSIKIEGNVITNSIWTKAIDSKHQIIFGIFYEKEEALKYLKENRIGEREIKSLDIDLNKLEQYFE